MRTLISYIAAAFLVVISSYSASGATLSIVDGNSGAGFDMVGGGVPSGPLSNSNGDNDFLEYAEAKASNVLGDRFALADGRMSLTGVFGGQVIGTGSSYRYEFFGSEASYVNTLSVGSDSISTAGETGGSGVYSLSPMASFVSKSLDFEFSTSGNDTNVNNFMNSGVLGNNPNDIGDGIDMISFAAVCVGDPTGNNCRSVWLFLDDGGASENDDYDDMIIRITPVPLPAAAWMLIASMGGLFALRLGRRNQMT